MVLLQPKLNLKVSQKQILTPGLVQMVSVLALNKLELKDMIYAEMVENPVLEELDDQVPLLDEVAQGEAQRERTDSEHLATAEEAAPEKDPFDEIDFGSFFQDYLDPGYRSPAGEDIERPSFENFLSKPTTLTDHLMWQLGSLNLRPEVAEAAELIIGNLNEDGYLTASDDELMAVASGALQPAPAEIESVAKADPDQESGDSTILAGQAVAEASPNGDASHPDPRHGLRLIDANHPPEARPSFTLDDLHEAIRVVRGMDPAGVAARDLRECLLAQLEYHLQVQEEAVGCRHKSDGIRQTMSDGIAIVDQHLRLLQNKLYKEIGKAIGRPLDDVMKAVDLIRTLDPKPGARYNLSDARLVEPDVAFVKQGDEWFVLMNEDDVPQLRLNPTYKRLLSREHAEKDVRNYVKERYKSAMQLIKNIEQRKQTILKVCHAIIGRQGEFLEKGIDELKPMMIKEVAEEIGVHPSTVSRAVANKYVHTPQGVFELRYFFSESVQGPEGGGTSLLTLKRRVKKLIEEEDPARPLTDEQITRILQSQGIQVTRRTVAKYREDMKIPSTHQRRVKS